MSVTEPIQTLERIQEASFARASDATHRAYPADRRMDGGALFEFLTRKRVGVLATVRPDGRPQAAPAGYALVGSRFVFASLEDAARVHNLRQHPHVSLVVSEEDVEGRSVVIVEGTARVQKATEAAFDYKTPFRDQKGELPVWAQALIILTPERILSYSDQK